MLTSPSSLNSRIQSQQIGLLCNGGNSINNHTDLLRFLPQLLNNPRNIRYRSIYVFHIAYSTAYIGTACFCHIIGFMYLVYSLSQGCRELFHMGCKIVHTVRSCLHLIELLTTAACHIHNRLGNRLADCCCLLRGRSQLLRGSCQILCSSYNLLHQSQKLLPHITDRPNHQANFIIAGQHCLNFLCIRIILMLPEVTIT